ncbi:MAG: FkbM family methyltransferase [Bacteroidales bacterium]|jgi:FkbM family methyltransferase|nr:FkbM family methyltransferase [Bacteroidales bacterium]
MEETPIIQKKNIVGQTYRAIKRIIIYAFCERKKEYDLMMKIYREFITIPFIERLYVKKFNKLWLKTDGNEKYFDFQGALFPDISSYKEMRELAAIFEDVLLIPAVFDDNYDRKITRKMDRYTKEGPYGYKDKDFDVKVLEGDIVIDCGAWIGDFSAYSASKGAVAYAFEPSKDVYEILKKTAELNNKAGKGRIIPVQKALSNRTGEMTISIETRSSGGNSIFINRGLDGTEKVNVQTLDDFVRENNISKIDFIKADIEGAERLLLSGATEVLKHHQPKLAICTYHLKDDKKVLSDIILKANPSYKIVHLRHKLIAYVR